MNHKHYRLLGILHIVYGTLHILFFVLISLVLGSILPIIEAEADPEDFMIVKTVFQFIRSFMFILILVLPVPSIIGGIALLNGKKWGISLLLISGCLALLNLPLGTALGIYTLWVYLERNNK